MSPSRVPQALDPEAVRVGATVRMARELRGLKVGELASKLDISYAYLSNIEAGRRRVTPPLVAKIADVLRVDQAGLVRPDLFDLSEAS
jgi:transcriptional regulator with XRE-family HTH domain